MKSSNRSRPSSFRAFQDALIPRSPAAAAPDPLSGHIQIEFAPPGEVRVRKVISRAAVRPTTKFPSVCLGRSVHCESEVEVEVAELLDACTAVTRYGEQPAVITYHDGKSSRRHIPDFYVETAETRAFIEAKFSSDVDSDLLIRTRLLRELLAEQGYEYYLVTEQETRAGPYLANARHLLRRGRIPTSSPLDLQILSRIRSEGSCRIDSFDDAAAPQCIARLLLEGRLWIAMDKPILSSSEVKLAINEGGAAWALALFK